MRQHLVLLVAATMICLLPLAPAAAIILARALELRQGWRGGEVALTLKPLLPPVVCAFLVSMTLGWADYSLAESARKAANDIMNSYNGIGQTVWFQGHWGFQYYMEQNGAYAYSFRSPPAGTRLIMAIPDNNSNVTRFGDRVQELHFPVMPYASIMNAAVGAGYYSSFNGALPFVFGKAPDEVYHIALVP